MVQSMAEHGARHVSRCLPLCHAAQRTMRDANVVSKLRANNDPAKLYAILTESRAIQAA